MNVHQPFLPTQVAHKGGPALQPFLLCSQKLTEPVGSILGPVPQPELALLQRWSQARLAGGRGTVSKPSGCCCEILITFIEVAI